MRSTVLAAVAIAAVMVVLAGFGLWKHTHTRHGELWGYIDRTGKWVVEPQFAEAARFSEGVALVWAREPTVVNGKVYLRDRARFINRRGNIIIPGQQMNDRYNWFHESVRFFHNGVAPIYGPGGYGCMDKSGRLMSARFGWVNEYSEGLAAVGTSKGWGYIDPSCRVVIQPRFSLERDFHEGLAAVELEKKWGYIDRSGRFAVKPQFEPPKDESEPGYGSEHGDVSSGRWTTQRDPDPAGNFSEGLAAVRVKDKWGYIDRTGRFVIQPQFTYAGDFSEGMGVVRLGDEKTGKYGYVDKTGRWAIKPTYGYASRFYEGLAGAATEAKHGYIDKTGQFLIMLGPDYFVCSDFHEGRAAVEHFPGRGTRSEQARKYGFIDKSGKLVIKCDYDDRRDFYEGVAAVSIRR